jgi:hypothetical protein
MMYRSSTSAGLILIDAAVRDQSDFLQAGIFAARSSFGWHPDCTIKADRLAVKIGVAIELKHQ